MQRAWCSLARVAEANRLVRLHLGRTSTYVSSTESSQLFKEGH